MDSYVARYRRDSADRQAAAALGFVVAFPVTMAAWGIAAAVANWVGDGLTEPVRLTILAVIAGLVWPSASAWFLRAESSEAPTVRYLVVLRGLDDASGSRREWQQGLRSGELDALRAAVSRFAPDLPVTMRRSAGWSRA